MKMSEIKRILRKYGCYKINGGTNHEKWLSPITGLTIRIGRHDSQEVPNGTAAAIFKRAGITI